MPGHQPFDTLIRIKRKDRDQQNIDEDSEGEDTYTTTAMAHSNLLAEFRLDIGLISSYLLGYF